MITNAIITLANFVLGIIIPIFPLSIGFPQAVHNGANTLGAGVGVLNPLVPIGTLVTILGLIVSVELIIFGFKTFKWLFSHVPWVGGKG